MIYLSESGKVTLPVGVANNIRKFTRDFLSGELGEEFKYYRLSWSIICFPISKES